MGKQIVLYVVSTLVRSGPTTQLHNIIKYLDRDVFEPHVVTLSPEPEDSLFTQYEELNISLYGLELSRLGGIFKAKNQLCGVIDRIKPDVIHTQGIRADSLLSKINTNGSWLMTSRNYPFDDYPMKFGRIKGWLMARAHSSIMRKCSNVIACSKTIAKALKPHGITAYAIQNGVDLKRDIKQKKCVAQKFEQPVFISVGGLIHRKNMAFIVEAFNQYIADNKGSLIVLGDGPEMPMLEDSARSPHIHYKGNVPNVMEYLKSSDYFISASLSEGLPNTVLEALASGLPVLLSDIASHEEILEESSLGCHIFKLAEGEVGLAQKLGGITDIFSSTASDEAVKVARNVFSADSMSRKYQEKYRELLK
jgi:glycosyltransferase involved in cell wall biosynthesis